MLVKLQFGRTHHLIKVPADLMDWHTEHQDEFYNRLYVWLREKDAPYYRNGCYYYGSTEVIEWLNADLLGDSKSKAEIVAHDRDESDDADLPEMIF